MIGEAETDYVVRHMLLFHFSFTIVYVSCPNRQISSNRVVGFSVPTLAQTRYSRLGAQLLGCEAPPSFLSVFPCVSSLRHKLSREKNAAIHVGGSRWGHFRCQGFCLSINVHGRRERAKPAFLVWCRPSVSDIQDPWPPHSD